MAIKDSSYWEGRVAKNTWKTYNSLEERNRQLLEMYQEAGQNISDELYKIIEKINGGREISLSDMHKFNRLEKLQKNFEGIIKELGEQTESFARNNMREGFKEVYQTTSKAISSEKFTAPNKAMMDELLDRPWLGDTFSTRLWKNTSVLASNLNERLVAGLQQGKTIAEISIGLANDMMQGFNFTHRLVRTETMHYLNNSALRSYRDRGITHVQVWAAEDERTCTHCMRYHGKIYPIDKAPILPVHANCRCTILPVVDVFNDKQRAAVNRYISSDSYKINEKLRDGSLLTDEEKEFIKDLDDALDMLPEHQGEVIRTLNFVNTDAKDEFLRAHRMGDKVNHKQYISTSSEIGYNPDAEIEVFIKSKTGKDLRIYNQGEAEILFKRDSDFIVTDRFEKSDKIFVFMEEE